MDEQLDFYLANSKIDENTSVITSDAKGREWLENALAVYDPTNKQYSTVLDYTGSAQTITQSVLTTIGQNTQTSLDKVLQANAIIKQYINTSDIIGLIVSAIQNSINTDFRLSYKNFGTQKKKSNQLAKTRELIDDFNSQVDIKSFIRSAITTAYCEGNYLCCLRNSNENWVIDQYPLGIAEVSQYTESSRPIIQINMQRLKDALQKTILKDKRGKALYFEDTLKEVQAAFGDEILKAYKNKDDYCRMPTEFTGVVRVNNFGKFYGLSPLFRAMPDMLMLDTLRDADTALAKTKAKAIIHQKLRKEAAGINGDKQDFETLAWSHKNLMSAFKQGTCIVTTLPQVEEIVYITHGAEEVSTEKQNAYMMRALSSLGVSFLYPNADANAATAKISWAVLLQQINAIGEQVERLLENFYRTILTTNNIDLVYMPSIKIIDSEILDNNLKITFADKLFGTFACSRKTVFEVLGMDIEEEKARREAENEEKLDEIFTPHQLSFTTPGGADSNPNGRPTKTNSDNPDKQDYDKNYNEDAR